MNILQAEKIETLLSSMGIEEYNLIYFKKRKKGGYFCGWRSRGEGAYHDGMALLIAKMAKNIARDYGTSPEEEIEDIIKMLKNKAKQELKTIGKSKDN